MFGFGFKAKVNRALSRYFDYKPSNMYDPILRRMAREVRASGGNEYDVCILFMATLMNMLEGNDREALSFLRNHIKNIRLVAPFSTMSKNELEDLIEEVAKSHDFSEETPKVTSNYDTFDEYYAEYKAACAEANPQLEVDENGKSLLDFMDHSPTKRAYRDGVDPVWLGHEFGKSFDLMKFGSKTFNSR